MIGSSPTSDPSEMKLDRHYMSGSDLKLGSSGVIAPHIMNDTARSTSTVHNSSATNLSSITSTSDYDLNQATHEEDITDGQLIHTSREEVLY